MKIKYNIPTLSHLINAIMNLDTHSTKEYNESISFFFFITIFIIDVQSVESDMININYLANLR